MDRFFASINRWLKFFGENLQSMVLLIFRLVWGYQFFTAGLGKFLNLAKTMSTFQGLGIPFPEVNAVLVAFLECVGGLCLLFGLGTRLFAFALSIVMIVAFLTAHFDAVQHFFSNPLGITEEPPFMFLLASLVLLAFGPGKISLDYWLGSDSKN